MILLVKLLICGIAHAKHHTVRRVENGLGGDNILMHFSASLPFEALLARRSLGVAGAKEGNIKF